jgi:hypothetical protein
VNAALYYWRGDPLALTSLVLVVALICGLLGMVVLGPPAGAPRTDTAYGRYLHAINSSDVFVNVPGPVLPAIRQVERLPTRSCSPPGWPGSSTPGWAPEKLVPSVLDRMGPWNPSIARSRSCWKPTGSRPCCGSPP